MTAAAFDQRDRIGPVPRVKAIGPTRAQLLADWDTLITFLRNNPDIPLPVLGHQFPPIAAKDRAEVDQLAAKLGVTPTHTRSAHRAVRSFGRVDLVVLAPALEAS